MRAGVDFNTLIQAAVDERVNLALQRLEELRFPKWMNEEDAAAYLGVSKKALGNARRAGRVVGHRVAGNGFTYCRADLDAFAQDS